jgi:hypothetical protein
VCALRPADIPRTPVGVRLLGVRRACARLSPSPHGCVRAGRPPGGGLWAKQAGPAAVRRCPRTNTPRFPRSASEQCSRVGGHTFTLFTAMSPPGTLPRKAAWGTSTGTSTGTGGVHNREHGAGRCRYIWANSDIHGGGNSPPPCDLRVRSDMPRGQDCAVTGLRARACPVNGLVTGLVMSGLWVLGVVS